MKLDRRSPRSLALSLRVIASSAVAVVIGWATGRVPRMRPSRPRLVLHSHLVAGNVRAFIERAPASFFERWDVRFLHLDPRGGGHDRVRALHAHRFRDLIWVARSDVLLCTHGAGLLRMLQRGLPSLHFVDVWHGVGFVDRRRYVGAVRGFRALLQPSEWAERFLHDLGVDPGRTVVTGHALWDVALDPASARRCEAQLGLQAGRPRVLVAPTWTHGPLWRQRDAFGTTWDEIVEVLDRWADQHGVDVIFRSHLNAGGGVGGPLRRVRNVPFRSYPDTAALLAACDVLVTDWSSIGNDFLPLGRPIVYLDVPPPFTVGHLGPEDRPGPLVSSVAALIEAIEEAVLQPQDHFQRYGPHRVRVSAKVHGDMADGRCVERYVAVLEQLVASR